MTDSIRRVFLSYSAQDGQEVERLDLELRRRGVPLWRDRTELLKGRPAEDEIARAANQSAGFAFYLTSHAVQSEWVREKERGHALQNLKLKKGFGIVPIFREDLKTLVADFQRLGTGGPGTDYDIGRFHGYKMDLAKIGRGDLDQEIAAAANTVLLSLMETLRDGARAGDRLRIGLATRKGPGLQDRPLHLLLDWTADYEPLGRVPDAAFYDRELDPALGSLANAVQSWPGLALQLVPKCHLTMALAVGFKLRRTFSADLEVVEILTGEAWAGPPVPLPPPPDLWTLKTRNPPKGSSPSSTVIVTIGISRPIARTVKGFLTSSGLAYGQRLDFEPRPGPSLTVLQGLAPDVAHRMAVAVREEIVRAQIRIGQGEVHLFFAGPPAFAVLLGQQLANVGRIQTYEWLDSVSRYEPAFQLRSS
ncbi:MAG TPA: SAVED domain-containing protein [Thermoanaerobaculia bacterium]